MKLELAKKYYPEYEKIFKLSGGQKPRKFVQAIQTIICPARFNPSAQGDFAYTKSYAYNTVTNEIKKGPTYSYDTMMSTIPNPYEREVDVPFDTRIWVTIFDGQWGGSWSVSVFVHLKSLPMPLKELNYLN